MSNGLAFDRHRLLAFCLLLQRIVNWRESRAINVTASAAFDIEFSIGVHDLASADCMRGTALNGHSFENVVVNVLVMGLRRDCLCCFRVPDDNVGIGAR